MTSAVPISTSAFRPRPSASIACILVGALFMASCGPAQIILTAEAAIAATEAVLPAIDSAAGIGEGTTALVLTYVDAASQCLENAATVIGSSQTVTAVQAASITAGCGKIVAPALPPGTPKNVAAAVQAVASALAVFFSQLPTATTPAAAHFLPDSKPVKISAKDRARITSVQGRAQKVRAEVAKRRR